MLLRRSFKADVKLRQIGKIIFHHFLDFRLIGFFEHLIGNDRIEHHRQDNHKPKRDTAVQPAKKQLAFLHT